MIKKDIAIAVLNLVQFYSVKAGIDYLIKMGYVIDIYIPYNKTDNGFGNQFDDSYKVLKKLNYSIRRKSNKNIKYKILLEPFPIDAYFKISFEYRIKYKYSLLSAKPNPVYKTDNNIYYDLILCHSNYDADFLSVYSKTAVIDTLKYIDFKKNKKAVTNRKTLLYLPTYGDVSSIDNMIEELKKLKKNYYIIVKMHHGTTSFDSEKNRVEKLKKIADECYDHTTELSILLSKADAVLSDNSGAIFEAIYTKTPIALFASDINNRNLENFDTTQYKLYKKGYILWTNKVDEISSVLKMCMTNEYIKKISKLSDELFYKSKDPVREFVKIIQDYLNDNIDIDYKKMHDILLKEYIDSKNLINSLNEDNSNYQQRITAYEEENKKYLNINSNLIEEKEKLLNENSNLIEEKEKILNENSNLMEEKEKILNEKELLNKQLDYYKNGKLYKICNKIYSIKKKNR